MSADSNQVRKRVIGCAYAVSSALGSGFLESVYDGALALEMAAAGLNFARQQRSPVRYRGTVVGEFIADDLVDRRVIVEIKAVRSIVPEHQAQLLN